MKIIIEIPKEFECDYNDDRFEEFFERVKCDIPYGILQELIDKSVPMKPVLCRSNHHSSDMKEYKCPNCNQIMLKQVCITKHKPNYCYKCGQALDWSE